MPIEEDEHGTYIMNSKDLSALEHVERLINIGVKSLKIEGRTKSHYYVARTTQVYRQAIDDAEAGRPFNARCWVHWKTWPIAATQTASCSATRTRTTRITCRASRDSVKQRFVGGLTGYDPVNRHGPY